MRKNWPKCTKCKSKNTEIIEIWTGFGISWLPDGERDEGWKDDGYPIHVEGHCLDCEHRWRMRKITQIQTEWWEETE